MKIILITDNDTGEIIKAYTEKKFIEVANKEYYEANDFNGNPNYFTVDSIDFVINWYIDTSEDNLSLDVIDLECTDEEVQETHLTMAKDDWHEVIVNKEVQLHIHVDDEGSYHADFYKWNERIEEDADLKRDYDNDFISSMYASREDLDEVEND